MAFKKISSPSTSFIALSLALASQPCLLFAQDTKTDEKTETSSVIAENVQIFEASFFTPFQVNTVFDMVQRVPGFVFISGNNQARGFEGAAGNVLIDGQRPTSKAGLSQTLSRINAASVERIELITGGKAGIDMFGHRQILNVIRKNAKAPAFTAAITLRQAQADDPKGVLFGAFSSNNNAISTDYNISLFSFWDNDVNNFERVQKDTNGNIRLLKAKRSAGGEGIEQEFSHKRPLFGGTLSLNGQYNPLNYTSQSSYFGSNTATESEDFTEIVTENGLSYERKLGQKLKGSFNLLRRQTRERLEANYQDATEESRYFERLIVKEQILNAKLTQDLSSKLTLIYGAEQVYNSRSTQADFKINGTDGGVPTTSVLVEEDRSEVFGTLSWKATPKLSLESELKIEESTISVANSNRSDNFTYYKPRFQATYALNDKDKLTFLVQRTVDQLSFGSFASSVELESDIVRLGNSELVPQKTWLSRLTYQKSFWETGVATFSYSHFSYEDTNDYIALIDNGKPFSAYGNLGDGMRQTLRLELDSPLDRLNIKGGVIKLDLQLRDTNVFDPIIEKDRNISFIEPIIYSFSFEQNLSKKPIRWGFEINAMDQENEYLATEYLVTESAPWAEVFAEYKTKDKAVWRLYVSNPFGLDYRRDRVFYEGLRGKSAVKTVETYQSRIEPMLLIRYRKEWN